MKKNSIQLKQERADLVAKAQAIVDKATNEKRAETPEEKTQFDEFYNQIRDLDQEISDVEKREDLARKAAGSGRGTEISDKEKREISQYNLMAVVRSKLENKPLEGLEAEMHQEAVEINKRNGTGTEGVGIPGLVFSELSKRYASPAERRTLGIGTAPDGGVMVQTDVNGSIIEALRARIVLVQMGANVLGGLVGNVSVPRTDGVTVGWKADTADSDETTPVMSSMDLSPKRIAGYTDVSKTLIRQTSEGVNRMLFNDFANAIAVAFDAVGIKGGGANEPVGIIGNANVSVHPLGTDGAQLTWDDILELEKLVATFNADFGSLHYLTNAKVRKFLKETEKVSGYPVFLWPEKSNELNGYPAMVTNNVPSNLTKGTGSNLSAMIYGNFNDVVLADWGAIDLLVDPYTQAGKNSVRIHANMLGDVGIRQPKSFAVIKDIIAS